MQHPKEIEISNYQYELPASKIAKLPLAERNLSKCLIFENETISTITFETIADALDSNSILILNNTKVLQARLLFPIDTHSKPIEIFCLEPYGISIEQAMQTKGTIEYVAFVGGAKKWKNDVVLTIELEDNKYLKAYKLQSLVDGFLVRLEWNFNQTFADVLTHLGNTPIPPYLRRAAAESDKDRYQTVFAELNGSVAAPTAGLHFTDGLLSNLKSKGVLIEKLTLHVGAGTFKPVSAAQMQNHEMHAEPIVLYKELVETLLQYPEKSIVCVGTTSLRALESMYWMGVQCFHNKLNWTEVSQWLPYDTSETVSRTAALIALKNHMDTNSLTCFFGRTQLIIAPPYQFKLAHQLFTNFHQPGSTLLLLVAAAIGADWRQVYNYALNNDFRFLSYGDGSLLTITQRT